MYLSIGNDLAVRESSIIGIFDLDNTTYSKHTRKFLAQAEENGEVVTVTDDIPKSFLLTSEYGMTKIYQTNLSTPTLAKKLK